MDLKEGGAGGGSPGDLVLGEGVESRREGGAGNYRRRVDREMRGGRDERRRTKRHNSTNQDRDDQDQMRQGRRTNHR